jgi:hypothetical protein
MENISNNYRNHIDTMERLLINDKFIKSSVSELSGEKILEIILKYDRCEDWKEQKIYALSHHYKSKDEIFSTRLFDLGKEYTEKRKKREKENLQSKKEKEFFMSQYELCAIKECYRDYGNNLDLMNRFLLLSLLTDQPPLRTSNYHSMILIIDDETKISENEKKNYIFVKKENDKYSGFFIIRDDKQSNNKFLKEKKVVIDDKIIISPELSKNIYLSYDVKERNTIFHEIDDNDKLLYLLKKTTFNEGITFNICRSSYKIHQHYLNKFMSFSEKEDLSKQMRHSVNTADINYYKVDVLSDYSEEKYKTKVNDIIGKVKDYVEIIKKHALLFDDEEIKIKQIKKKRYDIIRVANKNKTKIRETSVSLYDIKYDEDNCMYY